MKVGDLVRAPDILGVLKLGLVVEAANEEQDDNNTPGHWIEFLEDRDTWRWFSYSDECIVEMISESR